MSSMNSTKKEIGLAVPLLLEGTVALVVACG